MPILRLLLESGADHDQIVRADGTTLLHYAVETHRAAAAELLLQYGANPSATRRSGTTPLHLAIRSGQEFVAESLLFSGASFTLVDRNGQTPLHLAASKNMWRLVKLMMDRPEFDISLANKAGRTALQVAEEGHHEDTVNVLKGLRPKAAERWESKVYKLPKQQRSDRER